eukprot:Skav218026  [mRNA]  locus=scaffold214:68164:74339:+ [translate_table: standard]
MPEEPGSESESDYVPSIADEKEEDSVDQESDQFSTLQRVVRPTDVSVAHAHRPTPLLLSLDQMIPPSRVLRIPARHAMFLCSHIPTVHLGPVHSMSSVVRWKPTTWRHCRDLPAWTDEVPLALWFYTDGSACTDPVAGAAAVFLLVQTEVGWRLGGFRCVRFETQATAPYAEHAAVCLGLLWLAQLSHGDWVKNHTTVSMCFDCLLAGRSAQGCWQAKAHQQLAGFNRALCQWIVQKHHHAFQWCHVKAHSDHPYNEAADAAAHAAVHQWLPSAAWDEIWHAIYVADEVIDAVPWMWFVEACSQGNAMFPALHGEFIEVNLDQPFREAPDPQALEDLAPLPMDLRCTDRLPALPVFGPWRDLAHGPTRWERQHDRRAYEVDSAWELQGFPDHLPPQHRDAVFLSLSQVTEDWLQAHGPADLADDSLVYQWMMVLEHQDDDMMSLNYWAFFLWGQTACYDLMAANYLDTTYHVFVEEQFISLANDHPMWTLLQAREVLAHEAPVEPVCNPKIDQPEMDRRNAILREPFPTNFDCQASFLHQLTAVEIAPVDPIRGVPMVLGPDGDKHLYIAHIFSGRRRVGDCHDVALACQRTFFGDVQVHCLSIDTAVDPYLGNLMGYGFRQLLKLIRHGAVALCLSGPPCETWTAARHLRLDHGGPRPLRSSSRPWGLHGLEMGEVRQVTQGTSLMLRSVNLELETVFMGGGTLMEHPTENDDEEKASIWRTALQDRYCRALPHHRRHRFAQYQYGAKATKPTTFRVAGLPGFSGHFAQYANRNAVRPTALLQGYDVFKRQYKTAEAKEYPAELCSAMTRAACECLSRRLSEEGSRTVPTTSFDGELVMWLTAMEQRSLAFGERFLADYQPAGHA